MKRTKVIYVISRIDKALAFEWIAMHIDRRRFDVRFVLLNEGPSQFERFCIENKIPCKTLRLKGKKSYPGLIFRLFFMFLFQRPRVVHAHLIDASLTALPAAWLSFVRLRIYTRHHSTYHHDYFPRAVRWDRWCNRLANRIVAISENVKQVLLFREKVRSEKVVLIHHGFDLSLFKKPDPLQVEAQQAKYNPQNQHPVVGVIARFTELKGIQYVIPAFRMFLESHSNAKLLLFNANGEYRDKIFNILNDLPSDAWKAVPFEKDIASLYHIFDVFVHVPVNSEVEAFGQTYVEALAAGVPSVFTVSGVASEFVVDKQNALVVPFQNAEAIYHALMELGQNPELAMHLKTKGQSDVEMFNLAAMIQRLENLYA